MEKLLLIDANYTVINDKPVVELYCLNKDGKVVVLLDDTFEPYFYVLPKQGKEEEVKKKIESLSRKEIKRVEIVERKLLGEKKKFLKVFCDLPPNAQKMRDIIKEWEEDGTVIEEYEYVISFYKRYLIDKQISGMQWIEVEGEEVNKKDYQAEKVLKLKRLKGLEDFELPKMKILAFDIETAEEEGKQKVIMISLFGENFKKVLTYKADNYPDYVEVVESEKKLLESFVEIVKIEDPDFLVGYNTDMFDFQVLQERADELKVKLFLSRDGSYLKFARRARISAAKLNGRVHIDIFNFINNILSPTLQTETLTLDSVSAELLGDEKIEMEFEEILKAWRKGKDLTKLAEYCLKDAELTLKLSNLLLPLIFEICRVVGQLPFDVSRMTYGQLVEWYLTKKAFNNEEIILNQPKWEEIQRRRLVTYTGAFVKEPIPGIHEQIAVLDFRSLYPSIITSFNISLETLNCSCCKDDGYKVPELNYYFCKKKKGLISTAIKELIEKRIEIKKKMKSIKNSSPEWNQLYNQQYALKIIANASYGMFAFPGAKWYSKECAESCTAFGRYYIKEAMEFAEKEGFTVVYGDTDSMFIKLAKPGKIEEAVKSFVDKINKKLPGIMELELQDIYKCGIFIPRGVGPGTAKKKYALIDFKGNLLIRGLEKVRRDWCKLARDTQEKVLRLVLERKDVKGAIEYVKEVIRKLRERKVNLRDLTIYEQLVKPIEEYKAIGPHVMVAKKMMERGRSVGPGIVIMFAITKGKGSISERAEPIEDVKLEDIDEEYYIHHQILPAALRVLTVLGVTEEELLGKVKGLREFV
jgi:DNA polymerase I/DNA polymerase-2